MNKSNQNYDTLSPGSSISIPTYSSGSSTSCLSGNSSLSSSPQQDNLVMPSQPIYILNQPMSNSSSSPSDSLSSLIMKQNAEDMQMSQAYSQSCMNPSEDYLDSSLSDDLDSNQTSSNLNMSSNLNSGRANRFFPDSVVDILNKWFNENQEYPYPDDNMTNILAKEANISAKQVRKWFANKRVRSNKCFKQTCRTKKERRQTKSISDAEMFNMHAYNKLNSDNEEESDDMVGQVNFTLTNLNFKKNKMSSKRGQITKCKSTNFNSSSPMPQYQYNSMAEHGQMISNELSDQVNDNLDQHQFYSDFSGHHQQQQHKSNLQRSASVQSAQELINLYNLSLWKNALLENSNNNNKTSLDNGHYGSMHCSQSFANQQSLAQQQQQQQQMQTTSSVTSAVVAAAALYNPYLLMNLFQNPIAFQAALTNRLLNLDNKTSSASSQQHQQQGNSFNESNGNNMEMSPNSAQHCYSGQSSGCGKMKTSRSSKTCLHKRRNSSLIKLQQGKFLLNLRKFFFLKVMFL